jgi:hypothetical protein
VWSVESQTKVLEEHDAEFLLLSAGFFLDFFFDLEDGDIFLRNIN